MTIKEGVKRLLREDLGCTCPDKVFEKIEHETCKIKGKDLPTFLRYVIGKRLLLYISVDKDHKELPVSIKPLFEAGLEDRKACKLNKFRLVIASSTPQELREMTEQQVDLSNILNDKTFIHFVNIRGNVHSLLSQ